MAMYGGFDSQAKLDQYLADQQKKRDDQYNAEVAGSAKKTAANNALLSGSVTDGPTLSGNVNDSSWQNSLSSPNNTDFFKNTNKFTNNFYDEFKNSYGQSRDAANNMITQLPIGKIRAAAVGVAKGNKNDEQLKAELLAQGITPGSSIWNQKLNALQRGESADVTGAVTGAEIEGAKFQGQQEATKAGLLGSLTSTFGNVGTNVAGLKSNQASTLATIQAEKDKQLADLSMTDKWSKISNDQYQQSLQAQNDLWSNPNSPINKLLSYFGVSGATNSTTTHSGDSLGGGSPLR